MFAFKAINFPIIRTFSCIPQIGGTSGGTRTCLPMQQIYENAFNKTCPFWFF